MYKVFLNGADSVKWATADDFNLLKKCLSSFCEFTTIEDCNIIHSVNWYALLNINPRYLAEKYVITHIPHDVKNMLMQPNYLRILPFVDRWIVMSERAKRMLEGAGLEGDYVPYPVDMRRFHKIDEGDAKLDEFYKKYNIPLDKYMIGSFQRDTEGADLRTPKYIKGPDVFFEMVKRLYQQNKDICVIIAGPRRFWLIKQLSRKLIPFVYVGKRLGKNGGDDIHINTLPQETINYLYNIVDLYLVSSRMEGGPKAIIECAAAKCKIISTNVGQASDILTSNTIYLDSIEAIDLIVTDIQSNILSNAVEANYKKLVKKHNLKNIERYWKRIYQVLIKKRLQLKASDGFLERDRFNKTLLDRFLKRIGKRQIVTILHTFHKPPWGGGNQFLIALKNAIEREDYRVIHKLSYHSSICIFNSFTFDMKLIEKARRNKNTIFMHRVDGPTFLVRGKDKELDDKVFKINNEIADITVFQSFWSLEKTVELGYKPVNPIIIPNAVDSSIFNRDARIRFSKDRKIRIISTSWSNNPRKGFNTYKWLDNNLDWNRFEYIFVGNIPVDLEFENIKYVPSVPSQELATKLKTSDIYIIASKNDPCSNALIEALSCGLPALYLNDGGHPELVRYGGLEFNTKEEILPQLERLVENYEMFQNLIVVPGIDVIAKRYLNIIKLRC
jgi:glycosyltransferase involved in cell wall biosynthesis